MNDICTYLIELRGQVDEEEISAASPIQLIVKRGGAEEAYLEPNDLERPATATRLTVCTDQSGLIGLLRHLHGRGFILLSLQRVEVT